MGFVDYPSESDFIDLVATGEWTVESETSYILSSGPEIMLAIADKAKMERNSEVVAFLAYLATCIVADNQPELSDIYGKAINDCVQFDFRHYRHSSRFDNEREAYDETARALTTQLTAA